MPKELTHILFADDVTAALKSMGRDGLSGELNKRCAVFHFGAIATDTLFYEVTVPVVDRKYRHWGDIVHGGEGEDTGRPIRHMLARLQAKPGQATGADEFAFTCGFLTHMALDIVFHPWIYAITGQYYDPDPGKQTDAQMRHRLVESWLDLLMLRRRGTTLAEFRPLDAVRANRAVNLECLDFFAGSFKAAWGIDGDVGGYLRRFYRVQMALNRLFPSAGAARTAAGVNHAAGGRFRGLVALFYPTAGERMPEDVFAFEEFRHPVTGERVAATLDGLWAEAVRLGADLLNAADEIRAGVSPERLDAVLGGRSLDVGLPDCPAHRAVHFDIVPVERLWGYPGPPGGRGV